MKILIQGAGLAGLTAARTLAAQASRGALQVDVIEAISRYRSCDVGLGLWPAAQRALDRLGEPGRKLRQRGCEVPPAAYRAHDGSWLSQSSGRPVCVRTICENDLRSIMYEEDRGYDGFKWSSAAVNFVYGNDSPEDIASYDLVIDATGGASDGFEGNTTLTISGIVTNSNNNNNGSTSDSIRRIDSAGLDLSKLFEGLPPRPFETLVAPSVRVAVVPLSSDGNQFFWFISGVEHVLDSYKVDPAAPLTTCLDACTASVEASTFVPMSDIIAVSSSMTKRVVRAGANTTHRDLCETNIVRIGDAANHLPNNLAQGASVAIEDGHVIGSIVAIAASVSAADETKKSAVAAAERAAACVDAFVRLRAKRVRDCRRVSRFTQYISDYPTIAGFMRFVPEPINSRVFDSFLDYSLGGGGADPDFVLGPVASAAPLQITKES